MRQTSADADAVPSRERAVELTELPHATRSLTVAALYDLAAGAACSQCLNRDSKSKRIADEDFLRQSFDFISFLASRGIDMGGFWMSSRAFPVSSLSLVVMLAFQACEKKSAREEPAPTSFQEELLQQRREKDAVFRSGEQSPLPPTEKSSFTGLNYYPPNPALRFRVKLQRYSTPRTIRLGTNTGEIQSGLRYGYFEFEVDGVPCRLQVYRMDDTPAEGGPLLFIPFKDATSGLETYAAGRYIDLRENTSGIYDLDFNRAFNPYCAYGKGYSCPVPPEENRLAVHLRAGEKKYE